MSTLRIAGATVNQIPFHWENNIANILEGIAEARQQKVDLVLFPELAVTGYGCEDVFLSEWLTTTAWKKISAIVEAATNIIVCVGIPVRLNGITYNGVCVIKNQEILGVTLKQNLARDGVHYEPRWFDAWQYGKTDSIVVEGKTIPVGDLIYESHGIRFGFEICEDAWRKKHRPGYRLLEKKVDLIMNPSASHFAFGKSELREREVVLDGTELFNCVYLFVNHLGNEAGRMIYDGDIMIAQKGKLLKENNRLSLKNFNLLTCDVDFSNQKNSETKESTDGKEKNEEFARASSLALFDYLRKSKAKGFVLSLSGGADSSLCAVIVAEMIRRASKEIGWDKFWRSLGYDPKEMPSTDNEAVSKLLTCAYQSTENSGDKTFAAAKSLADSIGAVFHHWSIEEESGSYKSKIEKAIGRALTWEQDDIALQNIQARSRSPIIWLLANVKQSILLTTSNRSEGDVGYATMDGDTSGSLAPIAGIDKPFIIQWLRWAQTTSGYSGLQLVNNLQPTAELRPAERAQTDEKDLMPYTVLVAIERLAIFERRPPVEVFRILSADYNSSDLKGWIKKFFKLWSINQWKRERFAPSFHFDDLNVDPRSWCRFPILSGSFVEELDALDKL